MGTERPLRGHCAARILLAWLALTLVLPTAHAVTGAWTSAASLAVARSGHTATLLPSGEVLVVGGAAIGALADVERYDPDRDVWRLAAALPMARYGHTATLLPSGKVLVVGGFSGTGVTASALIYDPIADRWSAAHDLASPRENHTATLLASGKVLVASGSLNGALVTTAERYDPATDTWSAAGQLGTPRYRHTAARLPSGMVLVAGGIDATGNLSGGAEVYDPSTNAWSPAANLNTRAGHTATLLADGRLVVVGGYSHLDSVEAYSPAIDGWATLAALTQARSDHTTTLLPSGELLAVGGQDVTSEILDSVERYDSATDHWTSTGALATARAFHSATLLTSGKVLVVGGLTMGGVTASAEIYDASVDTWRAAGAMSAPQRNQIATLVPSGKLLLIGGTATGFATRTAQIYDPATDTWALDGQLATGRVSASGTLLLSGKLLVAGGYNGSTYFASTELFDPETGTAIPAASLTTAREYHSATLLPNGKVLVIGGFDGSHYFASAELYDPARDSWSFVASLATARGIHTATLLASGKVLVAGGFDGTVRMTDAELYDPASDTWSAAGTLASGRYFHTATLLHSGKVLVAGGIGASNPTGELYDPETNAWSAAGPLSGPRYLHAATLLPSGEVLVTGGERGNLPMSSSELYDPTTNTWQAAGTMSTARYVHSATVLPSGETLIAGGADATLATLATSERYARSTGFDDARRPIVEAATPVLGRGVALEATGSGFDGDSEAGSGATTSNAADSPIVTLRRLDNDLIVKTSPAENSQRSDTSWQSAPLDGLPAGHYALTMFVDGVPGTARIVEGDVSLTVTPSVDGAGTIDPATPQFVDEGASAVFALSPDAGHHIAGISGTCGGTLDGDVFTTDAIFTDCSVVADFASDTFSLRYTAGANGSIDGATMQTVDYGATGSPVMPVPDAGYHFMQWSDGSLANPRVDTDVTADVDVTATFAIDVFSVFATAGPHGSILPAFQSVDYASSALFIVGPDIGYATSLTGDTCTATQIGATTWRSDAIAADCNVVATFALLPDVKLAISVTDGTDAARYGEVLDYVVTVANVGAVDAGDVILTNALPPELDAANTTWVCTDPGDGAACELGGDGGLNTEGAVIPAGRSLTWRVTAPVLPNAAGASIVFTVEASNGSVGVQSTDIDALVLLRDGFDLIGD